MDRPGADQNLVRQGTLSPEPGDGAERFPGHRHSLTEQQREYVRAKRSKGWRQPRSVPLGRQPALSEIFGSEQLTGALLDRLTHHVHILEMNGESYRLKRSRENAASQAPDYPDEE